MFSSLADMTKNFDRVTKIARKMLSGIEANYHRRAQKIGFIMCGHRRLTNKIGDQVLHLFRSNRLFAAIR